MAKRKKMSFGKAFNGLIWAILGTSLKRKEDARLAERQAQEALDKLRLAEKRIELMDEQKQGIIRRYRQTDENRINAMLRQTKQEQEIALLKLKIEALERELGHTHDEFTPLDWKE